MSSILVPPVVTGLGHLVDRACRESGELQYLRELVAEPSFDDRLEFGFLIIEGERF